MAGWLKFGIESRVGGKVVSACTIGKGNVIVRLAAEQPLLVTARRTSACLPVVGNGGGGGGRMDWCCCVDAGMITHGEKRRGRGGLKGEVVDGEEGKNTKRTVAF